MASIVGLLLIILGSVAFYVWRFEVVIFLKGLVVFSLLFWGLMSLIVGYAGTKARRQFKTALNSGPEAEDETESPAS